MIYGRKCKKEKYKETYLFCYNFSIIKKYKETKKEVQHGQGTAGFRMAGVEDY